MKTLVIYAPLQGENCGASVCTCKWHTHSLSWLKGGPVPHVVAAAAATLVVVWIRQHAVLPQLSQRVLDIARFVVNEKAPGRFPRVLEIPAIVNENGAGTAFAVFLFRPAGDHAAIPAIVAVVLLLFYCCFSFFDMVPRRLSDGRVQAHGSQSRRFVHVLKAHGPCRRGAGGVMLATTGAALLAAPPPVPGDTS